MIVCIMKSIIVLVTPLQRPTSVHKFMVSITCAPFARKIQGSNPDTSSALAFLAKSLE